MSLYVLLFVVSCAAGAQTANVVKYHATINGDRDFARFPGLKVEYPLQ